MKVAATKVKRTSRRGPRKEQRFEGVLREAYERLRAHYGPQHWWPAETPFEVCVGAILTQNTSWKNVARAIAQLKAAQVLEPRRLWELDPAQLAALIRPAGYYNLKAQRLRSFLGVLLNAHGGELSRLFAGETDAVRARLLAIPGIGPETADSMLLYAGGHLSFVIDAYTKRIFQRHGWWPAALGQTGRRQSLTKGNSAAEYAGLQSLCAGALRIPEKGACLEYWQDYHAQLVRVGNEFCRASGPRCEACPLRDLLPDRPVGAGEPPGEAVKPPISRVESGLVRRGFVPYL